MHRSRQGAGCFRAAIARPAPCSRFSGKVPGISRRRPPLRGFAGPACISKSSAKQTYFCTCYGEVELASRTGNEHKLVISGYHTPTMIYAQMTRWNDDDRRCVQRPHRPGTHHAVAGAWATLTDRRAQQTAERTAAKGRTRGHWRIQRRSNRKKPQRRSNQSNRQPKEVKQAAAGTETAVQSKRKKPRRYESRRRAKQSTSEEADGQETAKKPPPAEQAPAPQPEPTPGSQAQQTPTPPQPVPEPTLTVAARGRSEPNRGCDANYRRRHSNRLYRLVQLDESESSSRGAGFLFRNHPARHPA